MYVELPTGQVWCEVAHDEEEGGVWDGAPKGGVFHWMHGPNESVESYTSKTHFAKSPFVIQKWQTIWVVKAEKEWGEFLHLGSHFFCFLAKTGSVWFDLMVAATNNVVGGGMWMWEVFNTTGFRLYNSQDPHVACNLCTCSLWYAPMKYETVY